MRLLPASTLDAAALLDLFNDCYSGFVVPLRFRPCDLDEHLALNGVDLDLSRIADEDGPAAFALLARRGPAAWIGGMGARPSHRRQGLGERTLTAAAVAHRDAQAWIARTARAPSRGSAAMQRWPSCASAGSSCGE